MTITYAFFRGNKSFNKGELSKVHAYNDRGILMCFSIIYPWGKDKIPIDEKDIQVDALCKNCRHFLLKRGINWFVNKPPDIRTIAEKIKNINRGDSMEVETTKKITEAITFNLGDYKLSLTLFDGEFNSGTLRENKAQRSIVISDTDSLMRAFIVIYKALDKLDLLPCEVIEGMEQLMFENRNK